MGGYMSLETVTLGAVRIPTIYAADKKTEEGPAGDVVIIPVDQSKHAEAAFEWYMKHVHKPENVVHILHCVEVAHVSPYQLGHGMKKFYEEELEKASKIGKHVKTKYEEKLEMNKVKGDVIAESGYPGESIIQTAEKYNAAMIVMGSRGFGVVRRTVLGSVSHYVIHHTRVPVTIIPKEAQSWFF